MLNVSGLPELLLLDCGENALTTLSLQKNTKLKELVCDQNALTVLNAAACWQLETVDCRDNSLETLTVGGTVLNTLLCSNNLLTSLDLYSKIQLKKLDCAENRLSVLSITTLSQLDTLSAGSNPLYALYLSTDAPMTVCDLENCVILQDAVLAADGTLYVDTLGWNLFYSNRTSDWKNGSMQGKKICFTDPLQPVTYAFQTGNDKVNAVFSVRAKSVPMAAAKLTLTSEDAIVYNGQPQQPGLTVQLGETVLKEGQDYTLSYTDNINAGVGTITITAAGSQIWQGSTTYLFEIEKAVPKIEVVWVKTLTFIAF